MACCGCELSVPFGDCSQLSGLSFSFSVGGGGGGSTGAGGGGSAAALTRSLSALGSSVVCSSAPSTASPGQLPGFLCRDIGHGGGGLSSLLGQRMAASRGVGGGLDPPGGSGAGAGKGRPAGAIAALGGMLGKLFKGADPSEQTAKKYAPQVAEINALEEKVSKLSDDQLKAKTIEFRERIANGESVDSLLKEAFAIVREASWRVLGLRPFDVQLIGGMVLHDGQIAEMRTGEGKTLVAILPAYLNALSGKGVHVVTVNDYLARRDAEWVGQVPRFLGLKVGLIQAGMKSNERQESYACDITYVTNSELGFDFLRDNLAGSAEELVLRDPNYCIIDEVDSILIDEARTPLIISGQAEKPSERYYKTAKLADAFVRDVHYTVDEKQKSILLTEEGYEGAEDLLNVTDLYDPREQWASFVINALKAKELQKKDVNYIVRGKDILIVDEFTGRVMEGRRWSDGLHQAVEAKEGLPIQNETVTLASISYQNFFLQYPKLCGMTGTAATEFVEFNSIYRLPVTVVPTNKPMIRKDESDVVFRTEEGKWKAVVVEVARMHKLGRPVLVGTTSVEQSENLSARLAAVKIKHQLLNAKPENVEREAEIVAQSGRLGAVTISTNMAGRGTDIILGGNAEFMARLKLKELLMPRLVEPSDEEIPFQKKGRIPPRKTWKALMKAFRVEDLPIESKMLSKSLDEAQKKVETYFYDIRKQLFDYDEVLNSQREKVYSDRRRCLVSQSLEPLMMEYAELTMDDILEANLPPSVPREEWDTASLIGKLTHHFSLVWPDLICPLLSMGGTNADISFWPFWVDECAWVKNGIQEMTDKVAPGLMQEAERYFVLSQTDNLWKEHLQAIKFLQQAVGLRGYAQRDPLIEYKLEGYNLFLNMMAQIRRNVIYSVYQFQPMLVKDANGKDVKGGKEKATKDSKDKQPAKEVKNGVGTSRGR
ncbi:hypothetical protein CBR_g2809 [Chara braunii]|uniref:Protein translocase subunit SecA n=1 Tax=Chara braunii TaxID=69332 RepID=A0A388KDY3_CHABU|nr:hypothetical protein CBR_g2809 [Chara braunii]|eukprot:GBG68259.1 hypothetical protein CBR_g2809 [Chara braunii]